MNKCLAAGAQIYSKIPYISGHSMRFACNGTKFLTKFYGRYYSDLSCTTERTESLVVGDTDTPCNPQAGGGYYTAVCPTRTFALARYYNNATCLDSNLLSEAWMASGLLPANCVDSYCQKMTNGLYRSVICNQKLDPFKKIEPLKAGWSTYISYDEFERYPVCNEARLVNAIYHMKRTDCIPMEVNGLFGLAFQGLLEEISV